MSRIRMAVAAVSIPAVLALGGCSLIPSIPGFGDRGPDGGIEELIEGITGGEVGFGFGDLPESFPREVPLVEGQILIGIEIPGHEDAWQVSIQVPDGATAESAGRLLEEAGFGKSASPVGWQNDRYFVEVDSFEQGGSWTVVYVVSER